MAIPWCTIMSGLSALNAVSSELNPVDLNNIKEIAFYISFSNGVDAGAVQIEESDASGFAGTWAPVGSAVTFGSNAKKTVKASGVSMWMRARISTGLTNGTVSITVLGR